MSSKGPKTQADITLEPWGYQDQLLGPVGSIYLRDSNFSNSSSQKNDDKQSNTNICKNLRPSDSKTPEKKPVLRINNPNAVNFLKKNQQSLKSHSLLTNNYHPQLSEEMSALASLGLRTPISILPRKTALNTMCIGYYDKNPYSCDSQFRSNSKKVRKPSSPSPRPKTSEVKSYQTRVISRSSNTSPQKSKVQADEQPQDFSNEIHSTNNRLQKMLKIKQKLRQKLKKNSQQRDIERGFISKKTMRIDEIENEENKQISSSRTKEGCSSFCKKRAFQEEQKWKLFNKCNSRIQKQSPRKKTEKFFVILGNHGMEK